MARQAGTTELTGFFRQTRIVWGLRAAAALILGILVLVWPQSTVNVLAVILGIYFVILGIIRIVQGFIDKDLNGGGKAANFILGAVILAAGVIVIRNPFETAVFIVILIGVSWIFEGVATLIDTARGNGSGVTIVIGILIALAGVLVILFADGVTIAYAIFFGITLIAVGVLDLVLLITVGRVLAARK
ncbi:uncharacterized membrane protein HdeD (DUF308 family) [Microbacteriaceae bacterium SG_E_30_P1]|uniref:Uncharacterized membrane protein HdeD (DUF308 family) n=1 Tax=Antiquaquibacter oligotrophicus TaxID=2880260 RepID=A0ABT6KLD5_9MICO|nr:DUF308 domain-containing protein [Antiquaquibacter oligotrophicus]MDH6180535.1 uncharacterized membrane protein HdeD (DUF308 family) [Antiquaquibacter oligotrophicus]UDF13731.1 DUF308 domain-containing protein [Antiquaquibacter oligotrophicus]